MACYHIAGTTCSNCNPAVNILPAVDLTISYEDLNNHRAKIKALEAERDALKEALRKYGEHTAGCAAYRLDGCSCGYRAAREASEKKVGL